MSTIHAPNRPMPAMGQMRASSREDRNNYVRVSIAAILFYSLLIPQQFNITIGTFYLSPFRIFLLGATIYLLASVVGQKLRFQWPDLFVVLAIVWITGASYVTSGQMVTAIVQGGSHLVDIGLAYFLARATVQTPKDLRRFLVLAAPGVIATGVFVLAEAATHQFIVQGISSAITGVPTSSFVDVRFGLMRGMASFPHPILAGIFLASFLPLYLLSGLRGWPRFLGWIGAVLGAFTLSSAALLGLVVGAALTAFDWLTERIANVTWKLFLTFSGMLYVVVETTTGAGFYGLLVRYASLNSVSAYNRINIWKYGSQNIAENPWFGIGYADWDRPEWMHSDSFDWFWLILALRFGIPVALLFIGATVLAITSLAWKSQWFNPADGRLLRGLALSIGIFALGLNSVSLWLTTLAWFFVLLGFTVSLGSTPTRQAHAPRVLAPGQPVRTLSRVPSQANQADRRSLLAAQRPEPE